MAGTIVADDLKHSNNDTVGTEYIINGSAKCWVHWDGTGTASINDSLNTASITDNGTGNYTFAYSTNQSDSTYCSVVSTSRPTNNQASITGSTAFNTGNINSDTINDGGGDEDVKNGCLIVMGDLA